MITFLPIVPTVLTLVVETVGSATSSGCITCRSGLATTPGCCWRAFPYQLFLAAAAVRAAIREGRGSTPGRRPNT